MNIIRARPRCDSEPETEVESNELGPETEEPPDKTNVELIDSNRSLMLAEHTTETCPACKDELPFPRMCATPGCQAGIHHMVECSYPLNPGVSDEGYNQERICRNCFLKRPVENTSKRRKKLTGSARGKPGSIEAITEHQPEKSRKRVRYDPCKKTPSTSNRNDVSDGNDDDDYDDDEGDDDYHPFVKRKKDISHEKLSSSSSSKNDCSDRNDGDDDDDSEDDNNNMPLPSKKKGQANRHYKNWMGKVDKTKSKALYLGGRPEELKDANSRKVIKLSL